MEDEFYGRDITLSSKNKSDVTLINCRVKICHDTFANGIQRLSLGYCNIEENDVKLLLENNNTINTLTTVGESTEYFVKYMKTNTTIKFLNLGSYTFRHEEIDVHDLITHNSITALNLCNLSFRGLCTSAWKKSFIRELDIRGAFSPCDYPNSMITPILAWNSCLASLIHSARMTREDVDLIVKHKTLTTLHVNLPKICDDSGEDLVPLINKSSTLTDLSLRNGYIDDSLVISTKTLVRLDLTGNPLGIDTAMRISENKSITALNLFNTYDIGEEDVEEIFKKRNHDRIKLLSCLKRYLFRVFLM
jgi:hypothetical protein